MPLMKPDDTSPAREGLGIGIGMAMGFSAIAALPLGVLGIVMMVETARGSALEMPWSGYGSLLLLVFGSYFVAGAIGGPTFTLLRPLRQWVYGWVVTGIMLAVIAYGTMGVAMAAFFDQAGKYILHDSSQAEAWQMIPWVTTFLGLMGGCFGLAKWFQDPDSPHNARKRAKAPSVAASPVTIITHGHKRPSVHAILTVAVLALAAWARFESRTQHTIQRETDTSTASSGVIVLGGVSDSTDVVARQFIRLAQRRELDSAGHYVSPTLHLRDSTILASAISSQLPADTTIPLTRTVAARWTSGDGVTRTIEAYAVGAAADSQAVVLQTVEEMGVRWIERAGVVHDVIHTLADAGRASNTAAARLATDTLSLVRVRK